MGRSRARPGDVAAKCLMQRRRDGIKDGEGASGAPVSERRDSAAMQSILGGENAKGDAEMGVRATALH